MPHRLIQGRYVTVTKPGRHCRITEVPITSVSRSWRTSLANPCALSRPRAHRTSQLRTRARVEPESHERADRHFHIFVESGPNRTILMLSGITLNDSRIVVRHDRANPAMPDPFHRTVRLRTDKLRYVNSQ